MDSWSQDPGSRAGWFLACRPPPAASTISTVRVEESSGVTKTDLAAVAVALDEG